MQPEMNMMVSIERENISFFFILIPLEWFYFLIWVEREGVDHFTRQVDELKSDH